MKIVKVEVGSEPTIMRDTDSVLSVMNKIPTDNNSGKIIDLDSNKHSGIFNSHGTELLPKNVEVLERFESELREVMSGDALYSDVMDKAEMLRTGLKFVGFKPDEARQAILNEFGINLDDDADERVEKSRINLETALDNFEKSIAVMNVS